jgi:hypothetical protein
VGYLLRVKKKSNFRRGFTTLNEKCLRRIVLKRTAQQAFFISGRKYRLKLDLLLLFVGISISLKKFILYIRWNLLVALKAHGVSCCARGE